MYWGLNQDLVYARQVPYLWALSPAPVIILSKSASKLENCLACHN